MESLKNVLVKDEAFYKRKKESVDQILSYPEVRQLLNEQHLGRDFVESHWIDFLNYIEDLEKCHHCRGIDHCGKNFVGYHRQLEIDGGQTKVSFVVCPYGKKIEEQRRLMSHIQSNMPKDLFNTSFNDLEISNRSQLFVLVKTLISHVQTKPNKGIYLYGDMGIGKTYVMAAFSNMLAINEKDVAFISVSQMLQDLKRYFNSDQDNGLDDLKEVDVLILDDLGAETLSAWGRDEVLYNLLNDRMLRKKTTYFTSVYSLGELEKHYKIKEGKDESIKVKRLLERIKALSDEFELTGKRFR